MRTRCGFVSNSSSSSYICDICGGIETGYDISELGLVECCRGHVFCNIHIEDFFPRDGMSRLEAEDWIKEIGQYGIDNPTDIEDDILWHLDHGERETAIELAMSHRFIHEREFSTLPSALCPVCTLRAEGLRDNFLLEYLKNKLHLDNNDILEEMEKRSPPGIGALQRLRRRMTETECEND